MTYRNRPLLELARGQECTVRLYGICVSALGNVVTAHNPFGERGVGIKCDDHDSCWACSACHDALDGRAFINQFTREQREHWFENAKRETQRQMWAQGLIQVTNTRPRSQKAYQTPKGRVPRNGFAA